MGGDAVTKIVRPLSPPKCAKPLRSSFGSAQRASLSKHGESPAQQAAGKHRSPNSRHFAMMQQSPLQQRQVSFNERLEAEVPIIPHVSHRKSVPSRRAQVEQMSRARYSSSIKVETEHLARE